MTSPQNETVRQRLIVLGASNVAKSLEVLLHVAPEMIPQPLEVYAAIGRGRSYGTQSKFLCRRLPGILESELWPSLEKVSGPVKTTSVITDIGNDLLYDRTVDQIIDWIEQCIIRLRTTEGPIAITGIPLAGVRSLAPYKFRALRAMMFPSSNLQLVTVQQRAEELDARLQAFGKEDDITFIPQKPEWYGFDPIHWRQAKRPEVWHTILSSLGHTMFDYSRVRSNFFHSMKHWMTRPYSRTMFGIEQSQAQPSIKRGEHLTVALY
ncbi:SGNH/GDSL hydrolase family protein [Bremerella cremea]|uniref:SGNH/GDSL hydrolase family protein n=1 Tax=Bremerella cremea TaxID=1031537 RepID=UPI0031E82307